MDGGLIGGSYRGFSAA